MEKMAPLFAMAIQQLIRKPKKPRLASNRSPLLEYGRSPVRLAGCRLKLTRKIGSAWRTILQLEPAVAAAANMGGRDGGQHTYQHKKSGSRFDADA
jgi:hypothetical protein